MVDERRQRSLTEDDVEALADALEERLYKRFYSNLGKGVWGAAWKVILGAIIALAAYGAGKGFKW